MIFLSSNLDLNLNLWSVIVSNLEPYLANLQNPALPVKAQEYFHLEINSLCTCILGIDPSDGHRHEGLIADGEVIGKAGLAGARLIVKFD